ncbi:ABC transporter substrate-binding protein [Nitrospirillum sp. BR 11828]|uniref:ABC transporter substrate-binding protein n=1 Tax=Nitrospirillum sp. BR 11828 TaxID=3104325 RepID=UPI002ACA957C|nr:ABC transporter substrate-binding protein [Nitrospirillum sp. BR 11828]MDZ5646099.1 ABC transporter substrate-binding protein [Nitrospirillum sp. BR 11828]
MAVAPAWVPAWGGPTTGAPPPSTQPRRVVSLNLCTDQLAALLLPPGRIAALSHLAADPTLSYVAGRIGGIPLTQGGAEELLALKPDLVLAGRYTAQAAVRMAKAHHIPVVQVGLIADFDGIRDQVRAVAAALGESATGESLLADMDRRLAAAAPTDDRRPTALSLAPGAFTSGAGTLTAAVMNAAGLANYPATKGMTGYGYLTVEGIVADPPDLLITGAPDTAEDRHPSLSGALIAHPALLRAIPPSRRPHLDETLLGCGGPYTVEAVEALARARTDWLNRQRAGTP